jgi:hypothetical protein
MFRQLKALMTTTTTSLRASLIPPCNHIAAMAPALVRVTRHQDKPSSFPFKGIRPRLLFTLRPLVTPGPLRVGTKCQEEAATTELQPLT